MGFSNILVPVSGVPANDAAIRLACQVARQDRAKVLLIHVIEVQRTLPLNAENETQLQQGELVLERAEQIVKSVRGAADSELLQARVAGPALVDEAVERGIDLIILGVPYRKPLGDFYLGLTTNYILRNASCPVWLCREAAHDEKKPG